MRNRQLKMILLGLGSNIGNRQANLAQACRQLAAHVSVVARSSLYESEALLAEGAPAEWNMPFINMALLAKTQCAPHELLQHIKHIEQAMGRKHRGHWAPREIDIDILAMGEVEVQSEALTLPHPHMTARDFVLFPLVEIAPQWMHGGETLLALMQKQFPDGMNIKKVADDQTCWYS